MLTRTFLADLAERATAQYLESFFGFLLMAQTLDVSALGAAALGAIPAVLSLVKNLLLELTGSGGRAPNLYVDVLERAGVAYVVSLIALLLAAPVLSVGALESAAVAAVPAALAVLKGFVSGFLGRRGSAAALPEDLDPAA